MEASFGVSPQRLKQEVDALTEVDEALDARIGSAEQSLDEETEARTAADLALSGQVEATEGGLAAAVASLTSAINLKQDAAGAATDAELAAAVAALTSAINLKQDAVSAATDAELAAHEADTTNVHGLVDTQVLVRRKNDGTLETAGGVAVPVGTGGALPFLPGKTYKRGELFTYLGQTYVARADFTAGVAPTATDSYPLPVSEPNAYAGKKWVAVGSSITAYGSYTQAVASQLGLVLTNVASSGAALSQSGSGGANGNIYTQLTTNVPSDTKVLTAELCVNDHRLDAILGTPADTLYTQSFYGGLFQALTWLTTNRRGTDIFLVLGHGNTDGNVTAKWNVANGNGNTLAEFWQAVRVMAERFSIPVIEVGPKAQVGGPHAETLHDGIHLSAYGGYRYASFMVAFMRGRTLCLPPSVVTAAELAVVADSAVMENTLGRWGVNEFGDVFFLGDGVTAQTWEPFMFHSAVTRLEFLVATRLEHTQWFVCAINPVASGHRVAVNLTSRQVGRFRVGGSDNVTAQATGGGEQRMLVRATKVGATVQLEGSTDNGATWANHLSQTVVPNAVTDGVAPLKAVTDAGPARMGFQMNTAATRPSPLAFNVKVNGRPILEVIRSGAIPVSP